MKTKRILLIGSGVLLLVAVASRFMSSGSRRYCADSVVVATPFTNALLARSFEARVLGSIPGVLRLETISTFSWPGGSVRPASPNAVEIRILAAGAKPQEAQSAANEAAMQLCYTVLTNYGASGVIVDVATSSRRYSFLHDSFRPAVGRIFKR